MTPPVPVPMPPAIHVPAIAPAPQASAPFATSSPIKYIQARRSPFGYSSNKENKVRYWHVKHWKGAKHRKPVSRGQGRKAKGKKARSCHA